MPLLVYAIVPAVGRRVLPLRVVREGGVAAVVAGVRAPRLKTRESLVAYDATVRRVARQAAAILPVRFNTIVADEDELRTILRARQASLRRALAHVRNRVQMTIRVPVSGSGSEQGRIGVRTGSGTQYLRARAAAHRVPELDPLRGAVARLVRDERVETKAHVASMYHLIPKGTVAVYRRSVERLGADARALVSGPFPPYAFADTW